jgi:hypothetical protein
MVLLDPEVIKLATGSKTVDNSGGASDLTTDVEIVIGELNSVLAVIGLFIAGSATVNSVSINGNKVTVNITVPAGQTATVNVTAAGH